MNLRIPPKGNGLVFILKVIFFSVILSLAVVYVALLLGLDETLSTIIGIGFSMFLSACFVVLNKYHESAITLLFQFGTNGIQFLFFLVTPFIILSSMGPLVWIAAAFIAPAYIHRFIWKNLNEARKYLWLYLLHVMPKFRRDWHLLQFSPSHTPTTSVLKFWRSAKQVYAAVPWYGFFTIILLGSLVIPILQVLDARSNRSIFDNTFITFLDLTILGFFATVIGSAFWGMILILQRQPRHLVTRFSYDTNQPELQITSELLTQALVANLQNIGKILSARRSDRIHVPLENPLTFFTAAGQQPDLITQLASWDDIEAASVRVPLGKLLSLLVYNFARTRVSGSVSRSEESGIEIWVDVYQNGKRGPFEHGRVVLPYSGSGYINEGDIRAAAEELAVRLTFALGNVRHLASNWENLHTYIKGQRASEQRQWWHAYAMYRRWTQSELGIRGHFALGHFHLGSTLLSQGEPIRAQEFLLRARETSTTPLPELNYTLALVLIAQNVDNLVSDSAESESTREFDLIKTLLDEAISNKPDFAEAHHLLGVAYYQRGKSVERGKSNVGNNEQSKAIPGRKDFEQAWTYLANAVQHFRRQIVEYGMTPHADGWSAPEIKPLMADYFTAVHHFGDVYRSLGNYAKAVTYFEDVLQANPQNMRSFIDLLMTHCLDEEWQKVINLVETERVGRGYALWHADASLYLGWAYAGLARKHRDAENMRQALMYLDFALTLRPRFAKPRRQTAWIEQFTPKKEYTEKEGDDLRKIQLADENSRDREFSLAATWLAHRMQSFKASSEETEIHDLIVRHLVEGFGRNLNSDPVQKLKRAVANQLLRQDRSMLLFSIPRDLDNGNSTTEIPSYKPEKVKGFSNRLSIANYAEYVLLRCRTSAERRDWAALLDTARSARRKINGWHARWYEVSSNQPAEYPFSPYVSRYQILSLGAWEVLAQLELDWFFAPSAQRNTGDEEQAHDIVGIILKKWEYLSFSDLERAADAHYQLRHPLYLYVRARFLETNKLYREANGAYNQLLEVIEPFETKIFFQTRLLSISRTDNASVRLSPKGLSDPRTNLYYLERVSGQQSFDFLISKPLIHSALAQNYGLVGDYAACIEQLLHAMGSSPYNDLDLVNFAMLVHVLLKENRFDEALSVVEEALARYALIEDPQTLHARVPRKFEFQILECVLLTRLGKFRESLDKAFILKRDNPFSEDTQAKGWWPSLTQLIEREATSLDFRSQEDALRQSIETEFGANVESLQVKFEGKDEHVFRIYIYAAELLNNIAYNLVKLDTRLDQAYGYVFLATKVMDLCDRQFSTLERLTQQYWYIDTKEHLSLFYDTLAWLYFRRQYSGQTSPDAHEETHADLNEWAAAEKLKSDHSRATTLNPDLDEAAKTIRNKANVYKPGLAVPHYHLAYIYIASFEDLWQRSLKDPASLNRIANELAAFLRKSLFHWNIARRYDVNNRLTERLRNLRSRIRKNTKLWEEANLPPIDSPKK